jgi:hypothetical protein
MLAILAVAALLAAAPPYDTVFTTDGGRVVGTVIEEGPQEISIQLPDGTVRRLPRGGVARIVYSDGSISTIRPAQPPPAAAPRAQPAPEKPSGPPPPPPGNPGPPPSYLPPYPPPPYAPPPSAPKPWPSGPISPLYLSLGVAGAFPYGEVEKGVDVDRVFEPQVDFDLEGLVRLSQHLAIGLYLDLGFGDPARETRDACHAVGISCDAHRTRFGLLLRQTFLPKAHVAPWLSVGTGYEWAEITDDYYGDEQFSYSGWEMVRLQVGIDIRSSPAIGFGLFGGAALGRYDDVSDSTGDFDVAGDPYHTTVIAGARVVLFP